MGLIHIYCGNGKGKTTAALGLAMRASGAGMKVHIVQLIKGCDTSELSSIAQLSNITVVRPQKNYGFTCSMSEADKSEITICHNEMLSEAYKKMCGGEFDMLIIDEFFAGYNRGLIDISLAEKIVFEKSESCELVLTGRNPPEKFIAAADYVSEITAVKHPYENGIAARKGIEF